MADQILSRTAGRTRPLTRGVALAAVLLLVSTALLPTASAAPSSPAHATLDDEVSRRIQATDGARIPVLVEGVGFASDAREAAGSTRRAQRAGDVVRQYGGAIQGEAALLGAVVANLAPRQIRALAADPSVAAIHYDAPMRAAAMTLAPPETAGPTPVVYDETIGLADARRAGLTGRGITVAILDTGIAEHPAFGTRVKQRVDMIEPSRPNAGDPAGHGTHVAGIIAAGTRSDAAGIAPDADLVSVRVLDANGQGRLSTVIRGLQWVIAQRQAFGIRAVVLALGAPAQGAYRTDPAAAAVELAWRSGLVVITAAGNDGPGARTVQTPAIDPLVITVGASDDAGTASVADDTLPTWTSAGPTVDRVAKPDVVAPGRKIVSLRVPGSTLDRQLPTHVEGLTTVRFSGTSEAAAMVAGSVALLLQQRPSLTPDQVKRIILSSGRPVAGAATAQGSGSVSVARALATATPRAAQQNVTLADGSQRAQARASAVGWDAVGWDAVGWDASPLD